MDVKLNVKGPVIVSVYPTEVYHLFGKGHSTRCNKMTVDKSTEDLGRVIDSSMAQSQHLKLCQLCAKIHMKTVGRKYGKIQQLLTPHGVCRVESV